jgi:hypothetical protein
MLPLAEPLTIGMLYTSAGLIPAPVTVTTRMLTVAPAPKVAWKGRTALPCGATASPEEVQARATARRPAHARRA